MLYGGKNMDINLIATICTLILGSGGLVGMLFHLRNNKVQQKVKANEQFTEKRIDSLIHIKDVVEKLRFYELINLVHPEFFNTGFGGFSEDYWAYKSIMESKETLDGFLQEIMKTRVRDEYWISNKLAAALLFLERYILRMQEFFARNIFDQDIYPYGLLFFKDLDRIYAYLIELINNEMNNPPIRNEIHNGKKWESAKNNVETLFNNTVLDKLEGNDEETYMILGMMQMIYQQNVLKEPSNHPTS